MHHVIAERPSRHTFSACFRPACMTWLLSIFRVRRRYSGRRYSSHYERHGHRRYAFLHAAFDFKDLNAAKELRPLMHEDL
jgi:hypothetical protein